VYQNRPSTTPLKCLAQSARVVPSELRPQPPCAEPFPVQVEEGLAVATAVEESGVPPPLVAVVAVEEGRTTAESTTPSDIGATGWGWLGWRRRGDGALG
jgi:hypothetical protein